MHLQHHPIWKTVQKLMHSHDCVIVPGFGGFVCNRQNARIDQVSHVITPPGKHVVFNQNLKTNDGLLANQIAEEMKMGYSDAVKWMEQTVDQIKHLLTEQKQLEVDGFGRFRLNAEANYVFIPLLQNNYSYSSFGLMPVQASPVSSRTIKSTHTKIFRERSTVKQPRKVSTGFWPAMLATTLSLLLVVNAWIYFQDHSLDQLHIGDNQLGVHTWFDSLRNTDSTPQQTIAEPLTEPQPAPAGEESAPAETFNPAAVAKAISNVRNSWVFPPYADTETNQPAETTDPIPATTPETEIPLAETVHTSSHSYYVIAGVFWKEPNAERYAESLTQKGYKAEIIQSNCVNCKRVSIGSFATKQEAEAYLREVQASINTEAWIYSVR